MDQSHVPLNGMCEEQDAWSKLRTFNIHRHYVLSTEVQWITQGGTQNLIQSLFCNKSMVHIETLKSFTFISSKRNQRETISNSTSRIDHLNCTILLTIIAVSEFLHLLLTCSEISALYTILLNDDFCIFHSAARSKFLRHSLLRNCQRQETSHRCWLYDPAATSRRWFITDSHRSRTLALRPSCHRSAIQWLTSSLIEAGFTTQLSPLTKTFGLKSNAFPHSK